MYNPDKKDILSLSKLFLIFSLFALLIAYSVQLFFKALPCTLCKYQRAIYIAIAIIAFINIIFKNDIKEYTKNKLTSVLYMIFILYIINIGLSIYQVGIERKIFSLPQICAPKVLKQVDSLEDLRQSFEMESQESHVSCDKPFKILKISLAELNTIYLLITFTFIIYYAHLKRKKNNTNIKG